MRILFPIYSMERGGGCRVVAEAANGLVARGHQVVVALPDGAPIHWCLTAQILRVPALSHEYLPPADVVVPTFYTTLPVAVATGRPIIRFCLAFEPMWVPDPQTAEAGYRIPWPIITISAWLQRILLERIGRPSHVVNPGVDRAVFFPRGNKGFYGGPTVAFLLRGSGYTWKGNALFYQAMSMVYQAKPDVKLIIVANHEAAQAGTNLPHILVRAPTDDEFACIISAADVFVFPSLFEGFGLPPLEAMACGTAVVCTDSGGSREYARHDYNCLLVPPGSAGSLAEAILKLLGNPVLRNNLSANGQTTSAIWSWHRFYDQVHHLIVGLAGSRA